MLCGWCRAGPVGWKHAGREPATFGVMRDLTRVSTIDHMGIYVTITRTRSKFCISVNGVFVSPSRCEVTRTTAK